MLQTLNSYNSSSAKTAQIMARYRPIAPRPHSADHEAGSGSAMWAHLQSRPTRTRKRGRTSLGPTPNAAAAFKRSRSTLLQGLITPLSFPLPLPLPHHMQPPTAVINLNQIQIQIPQEKDLLAQLQKPHTPTPLRLIPSTVTIQAIKISHQSHHDVNKKKPSSSEDIEKELELQLLPGFVSDSKSQVRLVNTAYKQMVGQPECAWAQSLLACNTLSGNVMLNFVDLEDPALRATGGFSCWAKIDWPGKKKNHVVNAFGEAISLSSESNDYKFAWRFHTTQQQNTKLFLSTMN